MEAISFEIPVYVERLIKALEIKDIPLHSLVLMKDEALLSEVYYNPVKEGDLQRMFSISKPLTAIAVGLLAEEGLIRLVDPICAFFTDYLPDEPDQWLKDCTIEDCLMMRSCHKKPAYNKFDLSTNWVESFFTTKPTQEPGTLFSYDTSATHVLSALVERLKNKPMLDYIREKLPELKLSKEAYMLTDGQGVSMGGTGLMATTSDLMSLGSFLLQCKNRAANYLSPFMKDYMARALTNLTPTACFARYDFESYGYGYDIWMGKSNSLVCYGMGGQFIIVHPEEKLIFITTADTQGQPEMNQIIFDLYYEHVFNVITGQNAVIEDKQYKICPEVLRLKGLNRNIWEEKAQHLGRLEAKNESVFMSLSLDLSFNDESRFSLTFNNSRVFSFSFGFDHNACGILSGYEMKYCASAAFTDNNTLQIKVNILDTSLGWLLFNFVFNDQKLELTMKKHEETLFSEFEGSYMLDILNKN